MSKLSVNELTDETGSGAPSFPNGVSVTGAALTDPEITGGIYLGGAGSSNYLDDYEEGTFNVQFVPDGGGSIALSTNNCVYKKIGSIVICTIKTEVSSVSSPSDYLRIEGLPFVNGGDNVELTVRVQESTDLNVNDFGGYIVGAESLLVIQRHNANEPQNNTAEKMKSGTQVWSTVTYFTND